MAPAYKASWRPDPRNAQGARGQAPTMLRARGGNQELESVLKVGTRGYVLVDYLRRLPALAFLGWAFGRFRGCCLGRGGAVRAAWGMVLSTEAILLPRY